MKTKLTKLLFITLSAIYFVGCSKKVDTSSNKESSTNIDISSETNENIVKYLITFKDYDDSIIESTYYEEGAEVIAPTPTRDGYIFTGWNKSVTSATADRIYRAQYTVDSNSNISEYWTYTGNYYTDFNFSSTGNELLGKLQDLNKAKKTKEIGYKNFASYYKYTDGDPNKEGNLICFYSGVSEKFSNNFSGSINREHVWPNSRGGSLVDDDIHMPRPTLVKENSNRGNSFYVEGKESSSDGWDPAVLKNEKYRGIAARIIFYCCVANSSLRLIDKESDATSNKTMGKLSDLMKWNLMYPVDETELRRNNGAEQIQGNRNPFIDNPYLAVEIWGKTNSTIEQICRDYKDYYKTHASTTFIEGSDYTELKLVKFEFAISYNKDEELYY